LAFVEAAGPAKSKLALAKQTKVLIEALPAATPAGK
jgi:hypothetical protein